MNECHVGVIQARLEDAIDLLVGHGRWNVGPALPSAVAAEKADIGARPDPLAVMGVDPQRPAPGLRPGRTTRRVQAPASAGGARPHQQATRGIGRNAGTKSGPVALTVPASVRSLRTK